MLKLLKILAVLLSISVFCVLRLGATEDQKTVIFNQQIISIENNGASIKNILFNLKSLNGSPGFRWLKKNGKVRSLIYQGLSYVGKPTDVFAYYATPGSISGNSSKDSFLPAVVLVHGGFSTAEKKWVTLYAKRGYAAIAISLDGYGPDGERLPNGGPNGREHRYMDDQWTYHAVAKIILAHSLVRNFREVNSDRTAITGISVGGHLTCIVAGIDDRFKAAVPVYGCGFLHEIPEWRDGPHFKKLSTDQQHKWRRLLDPSNYIGRAEMPVFFVDSTNDNYYPLDSLVNTYKLVRENRHLSIIPHFPHSMADGATLRAIHLFIDSQLKMAMPLPVVKKPQIIGNEVLAEVNTKTRLTGATLNYTTDTCVYWKRNWHRQTATISGDFVVSKIPPQNATIWFVQATDNRGAVVSSELVFEDK